VIHTIRVIFGDTDQMGVVYYGNYMRFFESSRAADWRALGRTHKDLEASGVGLPVVEAHCRYRRPAYYEDLLAVHVDVTEMRGASMRFEYEIRRGSEIVATGFTRHAVIGREGRPCALPPVLRDAIPPVGTSTAHLVDDTAR
jgi:acyl-CoA thioester hydrolase